MNDKAYLKNLLQNKMMIYSQSHLVDFLTKLIHYLIYNQD